MLRHFSPAGPAPLPTSGISSPPPSPLFLPARAPPRSLMSCNKGMQDRAPAPPRPASARPAAPGSTRRKRCNDTRPAKPRDHSGRTEEAGPSLKHVSVGCGRGGVGRRDDAMPRRGLMLGNLDNPNKAASSECLAGWPGAARAGRARAGPRLRLQGTRAEEATTLGGGAFAQAPSPPAQVGVDRCRRRAGGPHGGGGRVRSGRRGTFLKQPGRPGRPGGRSRDTRRPRNPAEVLKETDAAGRGGVPDVGRQRQPRAARGTGRDGERSARTAKSAPSEAALSRPASPGSAAATAGTPTSTTTIWLRDTLQHRKHRQHRSQGDCPQPADSAVPCKHCGLLGLQAGTSVC